MKYARFYCAQDVNILDQCYFKFRNMFLDNSYLLNLDIDNLTIILSTANHTFMQKAYVSDGIYSLSVILKEFVVRSIQGERCITARNEKFHAKLTLSDFTRLFFIRQQCEDYVPHYVLSELSHQNTQVLNSYSHIHPKRTEQFQTKFNSLDYAWLK